MKLLLAFSLATLSFFSQADTSVQFGADAWMVSDPPIRYMPNYSTSQDWSPIGYFGKIKSDYSVDDLDFGFKARSDTVNGSYIDQLSVGYSSYGIGLRAGVLPYRITWCQTYDFDSVWMREPDSYCSFKGLADNAGAAPGIQLFGTRTVGDFAIDTQLSAYKQKIWNQSKNQGGIYVLTGSDISDQRHGVSVNVMHLPTATQARASILQVNQHIDGSAPRDYKYTTFFGGIEFNPRDEVTLKLTALGYQGRQVNPKASMTNYTSVSYVASVVWQFTPKDQVGYAIGKVSNNTIYLTSNNYNQLLSVPNYSIAYRHEIDENAFISFEYQSSSFYYQQINAKPQFGQAEAIGMRVGFVY